MANKATYFIRVDSYWQNSPDYFVGPFESKELAQAEINRATTDPDSLAILSQHLASDVKNGVRVHAVINKTKAREMGMRDWQFGDEYSNLLGTRIPINTHDMMRMGEK